MAEWFELTVNAEHLHPEDVETVLFDIGAVAVTLKDAEDNPVLEPLPGETPLWPHTLITGLFAIPCDVDAIHAQLIQHFGNTFTLNCQQLANQDWVRAWMAHYQPMQFGTKFWVCPTHLPPPDPTAITLYLDPGLAFGTGTHPTTALCLSWLAKNQHVFQAHTVIDYGCGSGILAIAAHLLGAKQCYATDIDPQALSATHSNAQRNQVKVNIALPEDFHPPTASLTMANILAGPLITLAPILQGFTQQGGHLILAGLLARDAHEVKAAYSSTFIFQTDQTQDGWTLLHGIKR